jgi:hypothetical protein
MRIKHSKFKNTGVIYELLVRQITSDILNKKEPKTLSLIEKYFSNTELGKEYKLYEFITNQKPLTEGKAESLLNTLIETSKKLNRKKLRTLKYNLISEIKEHYDIDIFFKSTLENYKQYAALYTLFESVASKEITHPNQIVDNKLTLLEHFTQHKVSKEVAKQSIIKEYSEFEPDLKALAYKILLEKFNSKYDSFDIEQKSVLREYINNVSNTENLKEFVVKKYNSLKQDISEQIKSLDNKVLKIKLEEVNSLIPEVCKNRTVTDTDVVSLLQLIELKKELKNV